MPFSFRMLVLTAALSLAASACATHKIDVGANAQGTGGDVAALLTEADALWDARVDKPSVEAAIAAYEKVYQADPGNLHALTFLTRAVYFNADAFTPDAEAKGQGFSTAISWGDKALGTNAGFATAIQDGKNVSQAVSALTTEDEATALYWRSSALGKWAAAEGFGTIVKYKNEIFNSMTRVTEVAPISYYHGPDRYWGAYYARAPAFAGGDMTKSREHFDAAIAGDPLFLGHYVLLAEYWATKSQDKPLFESTLKKVLEADPTAIEEIETEQRQEQLKAEKLMARIDELFID